jgi:hypothetical protein
MKATEQKVKNIFNEYMEQVSAGKNPSLLAIQKKHGYSESSAKSYMVTKTKTWEKLLSRINDEDALKRLNHIMMNGKDSDSLKAIQEMFKLKGRYPKLGGGIDKEIVELYEN